MIESLVHKSRVKLMALHSIHSKLEWLVHMEDILELLRFGSNILQMEMVQLLQCRIELLVHSNREWSLVLQSNRSRQLGLVHRSNIDRFLSCKQSR